jgi:hypothetical protein
MAVPLNIPLYEKVKKEADEKYSKPSAYKSGFIVKRYKQLGGKYLGNKPNNGLTNWFKSDWKDVAGLDYPVFRPTKRLNKQSALTLDEIDPKNLLEQIALKQIIKGDYNLPPFLPKRYL